MHCHYSQNNFGTQTQTTTDVLPTIVSKIGIPEDQAPFVHLKSPDADGEANSNVNIEMNCSDGSKHGVDEYLHGEEILVEECRNVFRTKRLYYLASILLSTSLRSLLQELNKAKNECPDHFVWHVEPNKTVSTNHRGAESCCCPPTFIVA